MLSFDGFAVFSDGFGVGVAPPVAELLDWAAGFPGSISSVGGGVGGGGCDPSKAPIGMMLGLAGAAGVGDAGLDVPPVDALPGRNGAAELLLSEFSLSDWLLNVVPFVPLSLSAEDVVPFPPWPDEAAGGTVPVGKGGVAPLFGLSRPPDEVGENEPADPPSLPGKKMPTGAGASLL